MMIEEAIDVELGDSLEDPKIIHLGKNLLDQEREEIT